MARRGTRRSSALRKRSRRRIAAVTGIVALLAAAAVGVAVQRQRDQWESEIRAAEAQRAELLRTTAPKSEFWAQVERKGVANKGALAVKQEIASLTSQTGAQEQAVGALSPQRDAVRAQREQMARALADAHAELQRARGEREAHELLLSGFRERTRAPAPES
jgi:uncharacterized iron-regulated protein